MTEALIVGVGHLGTAIVQYEGFEAYGLRIVAAFDNSKEKIGQEVGGLVIQSVRELSRYIKSTGVQIAVIAVPGRYAQKMAESLVKAGIKGIWNFAPIDLKLPSRIVVQRTDLATSFAVLSVKMRSLTVPQMVDAIEATV